ncbi:hypothetical protein [Prosthecobacter sp.]|uniref:hypothetical protein n=1 Tax=Prosthecobacter sp. TaxID=1965333 RepID=UPI003784F575
MLIPSALLLEAEGSCLAAFDIQSRITKERFYATWFQNAEALDGEAVGRALVAEAA